MVLDGPLTGWRLRPMASIAELRAPRRSCCFIAVCQCIRPGRETPYLGMERGLIVERLDVVGLIRRVPTCANLAGARRGREKFPRCGLDGLSSIGIDDGDSGGDGINRFITCQVLSP